MSGAPSSSGSSGAKKARIEIIPLIDVIFFLLATFVLFTLSLNKIQSITINLPVASPPTNTPPPEDENVTLQVSDGGTLYWNKELIGMNELAPRLQNYVAQVQTPRVLIASDDRAKYGPTIQVLDEVRKVNIKQVSIETVWRATGK
ncbi:MAG TPA: biopolymer transporter ExbD [Opitutaceae bacterium]|nr:biopolymer transporter ExbD [Opitutaceae bacterium]HRE08664.1 biopolymer transporter ExbD [Opitutaceae bacterium]